MDSNKTNSVLVTGGRGFIGRAVGKLLQRAGYRTISLDQVAEANSGEHDRKSDSEVVCDVADTAQVQRVFEEQTIAGIVHLAAVLPTAAKRDPLRATQVNILGSLNLLEMARRFGVRRFVFGSSVSVYGTCAAEQIVSEDHTAAPEDLYGTAKLYVERLGETYRERHGLEFVSLRIGRVVGPGARSATSAWRSQIFEFLQASGPSEIVVPYVESERVLLLHVDDVARMLLTLVQATRLQLGIYNAPYESFTVAELKREVERLNSHLRVRLGEEFAVGNPRRLDASRFQREFGFRAVPMVEQLKKAAGK